MAPTPPWSPWSAPSYRLITIECNDNTEEDKRKALEALKSRGTRRDAATAAEVSLKTLLDWRRRSDQFAAGWDTILAQVMQRLREHALDAKGDFKRSPLAIWSQGDGREQGDRAWRQKRVFDLPSDGRRGR